MAPSNTTRAPSFSPEYIDESREHWILIPVTIFTILVPILVGLRFWARIVGTSNGIKGDDWTCLAAMISALITNGIFIGMTKHGFGHHMRTVDPDTLSTGLYLFWFGQITYKISLQLTKISLLQLYMRIFGHITWFKRTALSLILILILYTLASCATSLVQCAPISAAWAVRRPHPLTGGRPNEPLVRPQCINLLAFFIFNASFALASDLLVLLLPLPVIYTLKPARHQKLALLPLFTLGTFIVVISTQRLFFLVAGPSRAKRGRGGSDMTWDLLSTVWTIIEFNLGIVCACAPIVRVWVLRRVVGVDVDRGEGVRVMSRGSERGLKDKDLEDDEFDLVSGWEVEVEVEAAERGGVGGGTWNRDGMRTAVMDRGKYRDSQSDVSLILQMPETLPPEGRIQGTGR